MEFISISLYGLIYQSLFRMGRGDNEGQASHVCCLWCRFSSTLLVGRIFIHHCIITSLADSCWFSPHLYFHSLVFSVYGFAYLSPPTRRSYRLRKGFLGMTAHGPMSCSPASVLGFRIWVSWKIEMKVRLRNLILFFLSFLQLIRISMSLSS